MSGLFDAMVGMTRAQDPNSETVPVRGVTVDELLILGGELLRAQETELELVDVTISVTVRLCVLLDCEPGETRVAQDLECAVGPLPRHDNYAVAGILIEVTETKRITCTRNIVSAACADYGDEIDRQWSAWCADHSDVAELVDVRVERDVTKPERQEDADR